MGDKPIIRIAVPGDTAEEFMQGCAKQFRGDFFVAIDQPVGKFVRIEAPFLNGDVGVRGDAIAMPAVRNGRKGLVIRLVRLDPDSLGIPIQESSKALGIEDEDDDAVAEFDSSQSTVASGVSAAVAQSIRSAGSAAPVKPMGATPSPPAGVPKPVIKTPSQPTKLDDLDDEAREAANEFGDASTRASALSEDLAKQLAQPRGAAHAVRRVTPEGGVPKQPLKLPDLPPGADDDAGLDSAFSDEPAEIVDSPPPKPAPVAAAKDDEPPKFVDEQTVARPETAANLAAMTRPTAESKPLPKFGEEEARFGDGDEITVARQPTPEELAELAQLKPEPKVAPQAKPEPPKADTNIFVEDAPKTEPKPEEPETPKAKPTAKPEPTAEPKEPAEKPALKSARTDVVDKLPASAPAKSSKGQLVLLIVLMIIAAGAGIALWQGVI